MQTSGTEWWYYFGVQVFGMGAVVLVSWMLLDASRRRGALSRFTWPIFGLAGALLHIPSLLILRLVQASPETLNSGAAAAAGVVGMGGFSLVAVSSLAYFTKSSGSGSTWFTKTREGMSLSSGTRERRTSPPPRAAVQIGGGAQSRPGAPQEPVVRIGNQVRPPAAKAKTSGQVSPHAGLPRTADSSHDVTQLAEDDLLHDLTQIAEEEGTSRGAAELPTMLEEPMEALTVVDEPADSVPALEATEIVESASSTTMAEAEPNTVLEDGLDGARLVITDGKVTKILITERSGPFIVGRDPDKSQLAVDDARTSRSHFSITRSGDNYVLTDLGSSNGTYVNGQPVREPRVMQDGDVVEFGRTIARFVVDGADQHA